MRVEGAAWVMLRAWYPIRSGNARESRGLPAQFLCVPSCERNSGNQGRTGMAYRVSAYNTSKHSENKIHDDTVARKFGFTGGLVPGVDVLAYMLHMPVAKWGRAFLERGLIEARFVKPVYDGEIAEVSALEDAGGLTIEG